MVYTLLLSILTLIISGNPVQPQPSQRESTNETSQPRQPVSQENLVVFFPHDNVPSILTITVSFNIVRGRVEVRGVHFDS